MLFQSTVVALFAALAAAQVHPPVGDVPEGNPIGHPERHERVPKGKLFTITWEPTTPNPVSILLLKGPSNLVVPIATLVENYENKGSFEWTPSTSLDSTGFEGYGIQIIDDVTGQYQYSPQFGLTGETTGPSSTAEGYPTGTPLPTGAYPGYPTETPIHSKNTSEGYPTKSVGTSSAVFSSGYPISNSSIIVQPTKTPTVPATLKTTSTGAEEPTGSPSETTGFPPESTGAASGIKAGLSLAGVMAVAAAFL